MKWIILFLLRAPVALAESPLELLEPWVGVEVLATRSFRSDFRPVLGVELAGTIYFSGQGEGLCRGRGVFKRVVRNEGEKGIEPMALKVREGEAVKELASDLCIQTLFSDRGRVFIRYMAEGRTFFGVLSGDGTITPFGPQTATCSGAAWCWKRALGIEFQAGNLDGFEWFYADDANNRVEAVARVNPGSSDPFVAFSLSLDFLPTLFEIQPAPAVLHDVVRANEGFYLIHQTEGSGRPNQITFQGPRLVYEGAAREPWGADKVGSEILAWKAASSGIVFASRGRPGSAPESVSLGYLNAKSGTGIQWSETLPTYVLQGVTGLDLVHEGLLVTKADLGSLVWLGRSQPYQGAELLPPTLEDLSKSEYLQLKDKLKARGEKNKLP